VRGRLTRLRRRHGRPGVEVRVKDHESTQLHRREEKEGEGVKIEIAIAGPSEALSALFELLKPFRPALDQVGDGRSRILLFSEHEALDDRLLTISRLAAGLEQTLHLEEKFDFRVRNLAYSEPPPFRERSPYQPIPGLTIQPHDPAVPRGEDPRTILLDAENAFGTGRHPTTLLCLKALARLAQGSWSLKDRSVLDFGCGTGLLAIAALKLGALRCLGVEIDHDAAQTARRNVALNALSRRIEIVEGSWEGVHEKYDLVLANLVASLLLRTGKEIPEHLKEEGRAVISGFSANQMKDMEDFFAAMGLETRERETQDGWACLVLTRSFLVPA
jgi:ribosomal protein L11 methyltransferase